MIDKRISALISVLRYSENITPLQKDILDTWHELNKSPFDKESARKQIISNNINHPDVFAVIQVLPGVVQKTFDAVTLEDMVFNLQRQLEDLVSKEMGDLANGKEEQ